MNLLNQNYYVHVACITILSLVIREKYYLENTYHDKNLTALFANKVSSLLEVAIALMWSLLVSLE